MKKLTLLSFSLLFCYLSSSAQGVVNEPNQYESTWRKLQVVRNLLNTQDNSNPIDFKDIQGSPYHIKQFQKGQFFVNEESLGTFNLRYNIYSDEVEVIEDSQIAYQNSDNLKLEAFLKLDNSKAIIGKEILEFYNYKNKKGLLKGGYFFKLAENDRYTLLLKKRCILTPAQKAANFNQADRAAKFNIYKDYYLLRSDNSTPDKLDAKKNALLKLFPEKEKELKQYIKEQKINFKDQDDLISFFKFASST